MKNAIKGSVKQIDTYTMKDNKDEFSRYVLSQEKSKNLEDKHYFKDTDVKPKDNGRNKKWEWNGSLLLRALNSR